MSEAIGMMEGAFFVPRTEILAWINNLLKLELTKIEQTCTGAIACQIMDAISPGSVPMHKVNWNAKIDYEYVGNYKILQQVFLKMGLKKEIEVERLIKGKYQDNLEFMQWLKRYYDMNANPSVVYDPMARRNGKGTGGVAVNIQMNAPKAKKPILPSSRDVMPSSKKALVSKENRMVTDQPTKNMAPAMCHPMATMAPAAPMCDKSAEMMKEITNLKNNNGVLQKERDFYFSKLRDLEILVHFHEKEPTPLIEYIQKILYATEDDKIVIDDKGNLKICSDMDNQPAEMMDSGNKMASNEPEIMQE